MGGLDDAKQLLSKIDPDGINRHSASDLINALDDHSLSTVEKPRNAVTGLSSGRPQDPRSHNENFSRSSSMDARRGNTGSPMNRMNQHKFPAAGVSSKHTSRNPLLSIKHFDIKLLSI